MWSYADRLKAHLAEYKRTRLGLSRHGSWRRGTSDAEYPHILPDDESRRNILPVIHDSFWRYWDERAAKPNAPKLHRDFAHLNSSQAFAFNLFYPYLTSGPRVQAVLLSALGVAPEPIVDWDFEKILCPREGTNFDVWIQLKSKLEVCIEVKLSEGEFGRCTPRPVYQQRLDALYAPRLRGKISNELLELEAFCRHYQILRNVSYAEPGRRHVVFLFPAENARLRAGRRRIEGILEAYGGSVRCFDIETMFARLETDESAEVRAHVHDLREKYVPPAAADARASLETAYTIEDYGRDLARVIQANHGSLGISIAALLPNPHDMFADVRAALLQARSVVQFLSYLFADLVLPGVGGPATHMGGVALEGFLGNGGTRIPQWTLLPAIGMWLSGPNGVPVALTHLERAFVAWGAAGRESIDRTSTSIPPYLDGVVAEWMRPYVPNGVVPNLPMVEVFVRRALDVIQESQPPLDG